MKRVRRHRLFFALEPGGSVREQVSAYQAVLPVSGRAVPAHQFHVTLSFLGMQEELVIEQLRAIASRLAFQPCELALDQPGQFGRAGIFWLGTSNIPDELAAFQHDLVSALLEARIGYDRKPWKFHLTLYRKMRKHSPTMPAVAIRWRLAGFSLIESVGVKNGVEYHPLGRWQAGS